MLLEKLESNVEEAQLDALDTFAKCARDAYNANDFGAYVDAVWRQSHRVAMNATKTALEEAALRAIEALTYCISRSIQSSAGVPGPSSASIDSFLERAIESCSQYLKETDLKLVWPNVKCLHALAAASSTANLLVNKKVVPMLLQHYNDASFVSLKQKA